MSTFVATCSAPCMTIVACSTVVLTLVRASPVGAHFVSYSTHSLIIHHYAFLIFNFCQGVEQQRWDGFPVYLSLRIWKVLDNGLAAYRQLTTCRSQTWEIGWLWICIREDVSTHDCKQTHHWTRTSSHILLVYSCWDSECCDSSSSSSSSSSIGVCLCA